MIPLGVQSRLRNGIGDCAPFLFYVLLFQDASRYEASF